MKLPMKLLRTAGLCLVAVFVMSMVAAGTASAELPRWETCATEKPTNPTKYSDPECNTLSSTGHYAWEEVKGTEAARGFGTVVLKDTKVPVEGTVEVSCTGEAVGSVGPGAFSRTEKINEIKCSAGKGCEEIIEPAKPRNLPWQGVLGEEGTAEKERNKIKAEVTESGAKEGAGWTVACKVLGMKEADECTVPNSENPYTIPIRDFSLAHGSSTQKVWLVLLDFVTGAPKATCSLKKKNLEK